MNFIWEKGDPERLSQLSMWVHTNNLIEKNQDLNPLCILEWDIVYLAFETSLI